MRPLALAMMFLPTASLAGGITIENPMVPLAPPSAMAHAGYMTLTNTSDRPRSLVGVSAEGYAMVHLHKSEETNGVATMSMVHQIDLAPGQSVAFERGGLHVMLMRPDMPTKEGGTVTFTLEFADGEAVPVTAQVMRLGHGS